MCFRCFEFACLVVCLAGWMECGSPRVLGEDPPVQVRQQAEWEARIEAALDAKGEWEFRDLPLRDVCEVIQEKLGIEVVLDTKSLEDFGIDSGTPITRATGGISNRSLLRLMLNDLHLTYTMHLGALWITTPEYADSRLTTKVYPVGDLLERDTLLGDSRPGYDRLLRVIAGNIAPDSWDEVGGPAAIEGIYDSIVVSQTSDVHEELEQLLTTYRMVIANDGANDPAEPTVLMLGGGANSSIEAALDKPLTADFEDIALQEVVKFISGAMDIPILIDNQALKEFGIDILTPISVRFMGTRLRFALTRMLDELELTYTLRDEILLITTPEAAEAKLLIGLYPVRDLVEIGDESSFEPLAVRCDFDSLTSLIESTIAPDSWDSVGGPSSLGSLLPVPTIVIAQSQDVHEQISELLTKLRTAKKLEAARSPVRELVDPAALIVRTYPLFMAFNGPDEVAKLVMRASEPGMWDEEAGTFVQGFGGSLVVKHNASGHREVQKLLSQLGVWSPTSRLGKGHAGRGVTAPGTSSAPATLSGGGYF